MKVLKNNKEHVYEYCSLNKCHALLEITPADVYGIGKKGYKNITTNKEVIFLEGIFTCPICGTATVFYIPKIWVETDSNYQEDWTY